MLPSLFGQPPSAPSQSRSPATGRPAHAEDRDAAAVRQRMVRARQRRRCLPPAPSVSSQGSDSEAVLPLHPYLYPYLVPISSLSRPYLVPTRLLAPSVPCAIL